jgi:hypothetical protein
MSAARDLFLQVNWLTAHGDKAAVEKLSEAAKLWRLDGQYFSAGIAMSRASDAAWGRPDEMLTAHLAAVKDFEQAIETNPPDSPAALAALYKLSQALGRAARLFEVNTAAARVRVREINSELAQRLVTYFSDSEHTGNYLVRGIVITTKLDGEWTLRFPDCEVPLGSELFGEEFVLSL